MAATRMVAGLSPDESEEESPGFSPREQGSLASSSRSSTGATVRADADDGSDHTDGDTKGSSDIPSQKRRRVSRACDECRRKKIKCDGKQPCTHCSVYGYDCTYDQPSNRRRNLAPLYTEAVEARLQRAEALLRKFMPDVDLSDPKLDVVVQQEFRIRERVRDQQLQVHQTAPAGNDADAHEAQITSMIETIGQLDLSEGGEWDFHGISSSAVFLRRMKEHFRGLLGNDHRIPFLPRPPRPPGGMFSLDSMGSFSALPNIYDLPPFDTAKTLCHYSLSRAMCLFRIVHVPSFYSMLDRIYAVPVEAWGVEENRFLGLMYSAMALGCMYTTTDTESMGPPVTHKSATDEGSKYYASARLILQDVAECRDVTSLQALVFMIFFLQAASHLNGCYAFVGIALRSALRMGLHRHIRHAEMNPIEDETRRRLFFVISQVDGYVSCILGFPILLRDEDVDQPMPTEVDDEYITKDGVLKPPSGTPSFFQAFNAHVRLIALLKKVIRHVYPSKGVEQCVLNGERPGATYLISFDKIQEIEGDLQKWYSDLPHYWRHSSDGPTEVIRVRTLLRFSYAYVQMMLYRPFLHYVSPRLSAGKHVDERFYACAAAGVSVSRNIVHIGLETQKQAGLIGPYWFILYTSFFAIISLVFYVLENIDVPGWQGIMDDARNGRAFIASLAQRSMAAERVTNTLNDLFDQLPDRLRQPQSQGKAVRTKKHSLQDTEAGCGHVPGHDHVLQRRSEEAARRTHGNPTVTSQSPHKRRVKFPDDLHEPVALASSGPESEVGTASSIYQFDAMMFPSQDPFAYPKVASIDCARPGLPWSQPAHGEASVFFAEPTAYNDIEGQLLMPGVPPYLASQGQSQARVDFTAGLPMYTQAQAMTSMPLGPGHGHPHGCGSQQQSQADAVLSDAALRDDWASIPGSSIGYQHL